MAWNAGRHGLSETEDEPGDEKQRKGGAPREKVPLTWRDYVALFIASIETVLLPLIVMVVVLFVLVLLISGHL